MNRKEYIELLANSPLPKSVIDKDTPEIKPPEFVSNYEQAVLNGFKGSESYFEKKYRVHDKLYSEVENITRVIESLKLEQNTTTASGFGEVKQDIDNIQNSLSEITEDISKEKELVNKRINDTNDKIEKSKIALQDEINIIQINQDKTISNIEKDISSINYEQNKLESVIKDKSDKVHKHNTADINGLDKELKQIKKDIEEKPSIEEVKEGLDNFYTKKETYSKREIDRKLEDIPTRGSTTIFAGGRGGGEGGPSYTPFVALTNTEREALTPEISRLVYCTDEIEGLYIYTSDGRQRIQTTIVQ